MAAAALLTMLLCVPDVQARSASIVVDFETGQVVKEVNADTRNYPASLVKLMTLYMAFEALDLGNLSLDQDLVVSPRAAGMPPSKLGLKAGDTIAVREVILALVTKSANDAAVAMAEALGTKESRFAQMMTAKARQLGMKRTTFRNASGLPNRGQLSTARDISILVRALIRDYPQYYEYFSTASFTHDGRTHRNHNSLLRSYDGADGLKTGYIRASGFNLAASAQRDGRRVIAVVFGGRSPSSRDRHVARLLDEGFGAIAARPVAVKAVDAPAQTARTDEVKPGTLSEAPTPVPGDVAQPMPAQVVAAAQTAGRDEGSRAQDDTELTWGVQVGAYYRYQLAEDAAVKAVASIPEVLGDTRVYVPSIRGQRGRIYRARLVGLNEAEARGACRRLESMNMDCLAIEDRSVLALKNESDAVATN